MPRRMNILFNSILHGIRKKFHIFFQRYDNFIKNDVVTVGDFVYVELDFPLVIGLSLKIWYVLGDKKKL